MRIDVRSGDSLGKEMQTYAEYRVFVAIQRFASRIESIAIDVREVSPEQGRGGECDITVRLLESARVHVRSKGPHPAAAVDRAAAQLECEMALNAASGQSIAPQS